VRAFIRSSEAFCAEEMGPRHEREKLMKVGGVESCRVWESESVSGDRPLG